MIVATWNVNSVRVRLPRLEQWLRNRQPHVVCLQETKVVNEDFPTASIEALGYHCLLNGQKTYNGVAILSRARPASPIYQLPGDGDDSPRRLLMATIGGVHVINVYAPNGSEVGTEKYAFKLDWYRRLREYLADSMDPGSDIVLCGDFNVAPEDRDVWDPEKWRGRILFSEPEKEVFGALIAWGFQDALRLHRSEGGIYSWWDYRAGAFHRGWGMRIDHVLLTESMATRCRSVEIDRDERKGPKPSDHAPVLATLDIR